MSNLPPEQNPESELPPAMSPSPSPYASNIGSGSALASTADERTHALLSWVLMFVGGIISPLVFFLIDKEKPFVKRHAAMGLTLSIVLIPAYIVVIILGVLTAGIGLIVMPLLGIVALVTVIMGAIAANKGEDLKIPLLPEITSKIFKV